MATTTTMATAMTRWAVARRYTTTMAMGDDDNNVDGNGAMGNEVDNDGDGATGNDNNNEEDGNNDNDGDGDSVMGSGATRYDGDDDGDRRRRG
jgi:hypothetical protein